VGRGSLKSPDGMLFEGEWLADVLEGGGSCIAVDGTATVNAYRAGRAVGTGVRWSADRQSAWRLKDGEVEAEVSLDDARKVAAGVEQATRAALPMPALPADAYSGARTNGEADGRGTYRGDGGEYHGDPQRESNSQSPGPPGAQPAHQEIDSSHLAAGEWKAGRMEGRGTYTYADGAVYEGEFRHGMKSGKGTFTHADGECYDGEWSVGLKDGQGTEKYGNGDMYAGEWKVMWPVPAAPSLT
jgi:hypothetical protein